MQVVLFNKRRKGRVVTPAIRIALLLVFVSGLGFLAPHAAFDSSTVNAQMALTITRITPDGEDVASERQIVVQFSRPVVPVGRMERRDDEVPIQISPAIACQWRWLNTSALACQLGEKDRLTPKIYPRRPGEPKRAPLGQKRG